MLKLYDIHKNCTLLLENLDLIYIKKENHTHIKKYMIAIISLNRDNIFYVYNLAITLDKLSDFKMLQHSI